MNLKSRRLVVRMLGRIVCLIGVKSHDDMWLLAFDRL